MSIRNRFLSSRKANLRRTKRFRFEQLEDRRLLAVVTFDPGDYEGQYRVGGFGSQSGIAEIDLSAGSYNLTVGQQATFAIDVDAAGNVTSQN